jgi:hypothetical protein
MSFVTKNLCELFKAIKEIYNYTMLFMTKNNHWQLQKLVINIQIPCNGFLQDQNIKLLKRGGAFAPISNWKVHVFLSRSVATLLWPSVGVKPNTWKKGGVGVLRDSRMLRARQQGPKHLALGCSWCHWKGLEA